MIAKFKEAKIVAAEIPHSGGHASRVRQNAGSQPRPEAEAERKL